MRTTDGFELAEVDLELRGEGSITGGTAERASRPAPRRALPSTGGWPSWRARRPAASWTLDPELRSPAAELIEGEARRSFGDDLDWLTRA